MSPSTETTPVSSSIRAEPASVARIDTARKKRRGPRAAVACDSCRTRRVKCDGTCPCSSCIYHGFECSYKDKPRHRQIDPSQNPASQVTSNVRPIAAKRRQSLLETESHPPPPLGPDPVLQTPTSLAGTSAYHPSISEPSLSAESSSHLNQSDLKGLTETNHHTEGSEFYGPTGTFSFLSAVRSQANSQSSPPIEQNEHGSVSNIPTPKNSVVNLLHSSDYPVHHTSRRVSIHSASSHHLSQRHGPGETVASNKARDIEIERECVRLYFQNLHCIHPILEQDLFVKRCEREIWVPLSHDSHTSSDKTRLNARFLALFNVVLALGAITAGETSMLLWESSIKFLDETEIQDYLRAGDVAEITKVYAPIRVARLFFERSKLHLEDIFESSSFETAQTLLLMAIFCQNALKPHSCYMYGGMALRTALAIGIPTSGKSYSQSERLFWWALYSHDIEMCCSAGRLSFLREAEFYPIAFPSASTNKSPLTQLLNCMVDLAQIFGKITTMSHRPKDKLALSSSYEKSISLERELLEWRSTLPAELDFELTSLEESELVTKQKIVLKLRFLNAKIFLKRPFLISNFSEPRSQPLSDQIISCVEAARETISFVHNTYLHRPYFRTWWYNCTYVLDASMVLLYTIICNIYPLSGEDLFSDVEKSLEIYNAMKVLAVARRCAEITKDVLNVAKRSYRGRFEHLGLAVQSTGIPSPVIDSNVDLRDQQATNLLNDLSSVDLDTSRAELYTGLVDSNLAFKFLNFEDWNAWSAEAFQEII